MAEAGKKPITKPTDSAQKHPGGRPFIFKTPKALSDAIDEYFDWCDNRTKSMFVKELGDNIQISDPAPYTMSGLAYALGVDRKTLLNYEGRDSYSSLVKRARQRVEQDIETRMNDKQTFTPGLIFNAKNNFGWLDQQQVDSRTEVTHKYEELTDEQLDAAIQARQDRTA